MRNPRRLALLAGFAAFAGAGLASGQASPLALTSAVSGGTTTWSVPVQTLLVFTALSFLPAILLLMTAFTRIVIVLSLLRHALGTQSTPPNQVIVGLSLFLTFFVMSPVADRIADDAWKPYNEGRVTLEEALKRGEVPLKAFMLKQVRENDLALFARLGNTPADTRSADMPLRVVVPAFVTSELKTAFQIGFMVFVPFLIIDLVVASVLMSMGMMMVSPVLLSLPFKLMLFVLADGWNLLIGSLASSFAT